jgi:hypothetical protein
MVHKDEHQENDGANDEGASADTTAILSEDFAHIRGGVEWTV